MCQGAVNPDSGNGHIHDALNSIYKRLRGLTLVSEERLKKVESTIVANTYFGRASSVITAVDQKLEKAVSAAVTLRRSANRIVKKCKNCRNRVSHSELQRLVQAIALESVVYVSENRTVRGGAAGIRNAMRFWNQLPQAKVSSFEFLESSLSAGSVSVGVPDFVLDKLFETMFGVAPTRQLFLRMCDGSTRRLGVPSRVHTVLRLKIAITEAQGIPISEQCLTHNGRVLHDASRLADECKVPDSGCVCLLLRVAGGMKITVRTAESDEFFEIDVDPQDTVESMMHQLHAQQMRQVRAANIDTNEQSDLPWRSSQPTWQEHSIPSSWQEQDSEYNDSRSRSPTTSGNTSNNSAPQVEGLLDWFEQHQIGGVQLDLQELLGGTVTDSPPPLSILGGTVTDSVPPPLSLSTAAVLGADSKGPLKRPAHGDVVCLQYLQYVCGYCNVRKVSTSTGGDGRVRIRCECGGKHQDSKPRMHAKWKLCREVGAGSELQTAPGAQQLTLDSQLESDLNNNSSQFDSFGEPPWSKRPKVCTDFHFDP